MDSTGKGRIRVFNCNGSKGVKELEVIKTEWLLSTCIINKHQVYFEVIDSIILSITALLFTLPIYIFLYYIGR